MARCVSISNQILVLCLIVSVTCSPPHTHTRQDANKERVSDGAFSPAEHKNRHWSDGNKDGEEHRTDFDHEAILGSRDAAEEFDQLPPEESKKRLRILAGKMDRNSDGFVSEQELTDWVMRSFRMLSEEESAERFEEVDANEDGYATWKEYISETYGIVEENDDILPDAEDFEEEQKMLKEDQETFRAADLDADGRLSKTEFLAFTHPEEHEHTAKVLYDRTMREKDSNRDGYLEFSEISGTNGRQEADWMSVDREKFDDEYDVDRDGRLNADEIMAWIAPNNKPVESLFRDSAAQEATHLLESADEDLDGQLTIQEIVNHHEIFVGSEATDYGHHLHDPHKFKHEL